MKTQKPNNRIDMFSEVDVHDYVSGHMSEEQKANFEKNLAKDESLQNAVDAEQRLRAALLKYENDQQKTAAVSDQGVDRLLAALDELGENSCENAQTHWYNKNWYAAAGVAASVMLAVILFVGQQPIDSSKGYQLLSDVNGSAEIDFDDLVKSKKVIQVLLEKDLSEGDLTTLFSEYNLKPIGRAGSAWIVASPYTLSDEAIKSLEAVDKFEQVSLISYSKKNQFR